jgi:hypothetical protein
MKLNKDNKICNNCWERIGKYKTKGMNEDFPYSDVFNHIKNKDCCWIKLKEYFYDSCTDYPEYNDKLDEDIPQVCPYRLEHLLKEDRHDK